MRLALLQARLVILYVYNKPGALPRFLGSLTGGQTGRPNDPVGGEDGLT